MSFPGAEIVARCLDVRFNDPSPHFSLSVTSVVCEGKQRRSSRENDDDDAH